MTEKPKFGPSERFHRKLIPVVFGLFYVGLAAATIPFLLSELQARKISTLSLDELQSFDFTTVRAGQTMNYYIALADAAVATKPQNTETARWATAGVLLRNRSNVASWNRLAYLDRVENNRLMQDGIAALYKSYEVSPFGDVKTMVWRVNFASRNWSSLPPDLRQKTVRQIPVIGKFGSTWEWRVRACRYDPNPEIYEAACAIAPGVVRPRT